MQPLISVVIPVHNGEGYLSPCLESLLAQTHTNWEAVVVDDGSTDGTAALCDRWAGRDSRIRVLHRPNGGVSRARNAGMEEVRGEYLAFVDGDDRVEPEYLSALLAALGDTQLAVCCVADNSGWNDRVAQEILPLDRLRTTPSRYANPVYTNYPCNKLYRTGLIRRHRIRFPEQVRRCEDAYFVQDYLLCCREISVIPRPLYQYVQRPGSAMHSFYPGVCQDEIPLLERQYALFHPRALDPAEEESYLQWEYGKLLAILRYLADYGPDRRQRLDNARLLLRQPRAQANLKAKLSGLGRKSRLARWLLRRNLPGPAMALIRRI